MIAWIDGTAWHVADVDDAMRLFDELNAAPQDTETDGSPKQQEPLGPRPAGAAPSHGDIERD